MLNRRTGRLGPRWPGRINGKNLVSRGGYVRRDERPWLVLDGRENRWSSVAPRQFTCECGMFSATASCKLSENGVRSREGRSGASGKPSDGGGSPSPVVEVSRRGLVRPTVVDDRAWDLGPQCELMQNN